MRALTRRLVSKAIEQVAGSGVGVDANGRLLYPDGLNPARVHRFIELVMAEHFASPKAALEALFRRVGVPDRAIEAAAIGTRKGAAAALGCEASWDAILAQGEAVGELARGWRARTAAQR